MATDFFIGESLVGDGNEIAHIDLIIGSKSGPAGTAFTHALSNQKDGFSTLLAVGLDGILRRMPGLPEGLQAVDEKARELWPQHPSKYIHGFQNVNVVGDYAFNSKNTYRTYDCEELEDCKFINQGNKIKNIYDAYVVVDQSQYSYEVTGAIGLNNVKFCTIPWSCFDMEYSDSCENSNHLFGCVSMRKSEYCILNKQYSKEEYENLAPKIIEHMQKMPFTGAGGKIYRYGEYFPPELCPFAYNETVAQEFYPLTAEKAEQFGSSWKSAEAKNQNITLKPENLPLTTDAVENGILKEIIGCAHEGECADNCIGAFKITPAELQFYRQHCRVFCFAWEEIQAPKVASRRVHRQARISSGAEGQASEIRRRDGLSARGGWGRREDYGTIPSLRFEEAGGEVRATGEGVAAFRNQLSAFSDNRVLRTQN